MCVYVVCVYVQAVGLALQRGMSVSGTSLVTMLLNDSGMLHL